MAVSRRFAASPRAATDSVVSTYATLGVRYDLDVVLPDGDARNYRWEFGTPTAQLTHRIAASALVEWATHTKDFFSVRCWSRRSQVSYRVRRDNHQTLIDRVALPDLLMHYLINVAPGSELAAKHHLDSQLRQLADGATIPIEQRDPREVTHIAGWTETGERVEVRLTPADSPAANYAFDVTPARLVTGLITERGVCPASRDGLLRLFPERRRRAA